MPQPDLGKSVNGELASVSPENVRATRPAFVDELVALAKARGYKPVVHPPVPEYDQLTQYVYQSAVAETATEVRVSVAVGTVVPDPEGMDMMPL